MDSKSGAVMMAAVDEDQKRTIKKMIYYAFLSRDFRQVNYLLEVAPSAQLEWLRDLRIGGQPLLHYLIGKPVLGGSPKELVPALDRFVRLCVQAGVDTEQLGTLEGVTGGGFTALAGAIHAGNRTLAESLVRAGGANVNAVGPGGEERLIFNVLRSAAVMSPGYCDNGDSLVKAFLNSGRLEINVRNKSGETPASFLFRELNSKCFETWMCPCRTAGCQPKVFKVLNLLLQHGADVSGLEIGSETRYHRGYGTLIKLLYSAGAKVKTEEFFFEGSPCSWGYHSSREAFLREVEELREWISSEGQKMRLDLKHLCRTVIRSSVRRAGDLQKKLDRLPPPLRDYVACVALPLRRVEDRG